MEAELNNQNDALGQRIARQEKDLPTVTDTLLAEVRESISRPETLSVPIGQLAALGGGIASLVPALQTAAQSNSLSTDGLYRWVNAEAGDALKRAADGSLWGAAKTASGTSKLAKFQPVTAVDGAPAMLAINPVTMMVAVALCSVERELGKIAETEKQICSFLEAEKEAEIEADVETLYRMLSSYKFNWENTAFLESNHKMTLDIQRTARKNIIFHQKQVKEVLFSKKPVKVSAVMQTLQKKFQYYRMSLYTFSMASLLEIMLSRNYEENYIIEIRSEIEKLSLEYRELFSQCSAFLEKKKHTSLEAHVLKGIGNTSYYTGKLLGSIPMVRNGTADEFLRNSGKQIQQKASEAEAELVDEFADISNPQTGVFLEKMNDFIRIYNHTDEICFDQNKIYLISA